MTSCRILVNNGVVRSSNAPPISTFLENHSGAYTTSRTHGNASILIFWERHLLRLAESVRILAESKPELYRSKSRVRSNWDAVIRPLVDSSLREGLKMALREMSNGEELAITALVCGNLDGEEEQRVSGPCEVFVHIGSYVPMVFGSRENGGHLAVTGRGRELALVKFSEWVRTRKYLEKLRPPSVTELLLSNDGDLILEGSVTNFFVICRRERAAAVDDYLNDPKSGYSFEVQTAPIKDGILPGVIRQLVIESRGIPLREVAPSWSDHENWEEAFVTNSLRLVQHVETIRAPCCSWKQLQPKSWNEVSWEEKRFEGPGHVTAEIQRELLHRAAVEGYPICDFQR